MAEPVRWFTTRFKKEGTRERAVHEKAYLKSSLTHLGVPVPGIRAAARDFLDALPLEDADAVEKVARALLRTDVAELRSAAIAILERRQKLLRTDQLPWLVDVVRLTANWAHVDWLATKVIGPVVQRDKRIKTLLRAWARDPHLWVRRTALLAQLDVLRAGKGDFELFAELAVPMLPEKEFFIRKAIGWILRDTGRKRPELVRAFVDEHRDAMSALTLREATRRLPAAAED